MAGDSQKPTVLELLRPPTVVARGVLAHSYLENQLLLQREETFAARLLEKPDLCVEIRRLLEKIMSEFVSDYDPTMFLSGLSALRSLTPSFGLQLVRRLKVAFFDRFRPQERLEQIRASGGSFLEAFQAWQESVEGNGVGLATAPLWDSLRKRAEELLGLLRDPELRTRWIP